MRQIPGLPVFYILHHGRDGIRPTQSLTLLQLSLVFSVELLVFRTAYVYVLIEFEQSLSAAAYSICTSMFQDLPSLKR